MIDRVRMALATLTSTPWRRAPTLLLGRPGVLATVLAASAVLAASVASVPLFLSSVGTESVALQASERCPRDTGASLRFLPTPSTIRSRGGDPFAPVGDALRPSNRWARVDGLSLSGADPGADEGAALLVRDGALDHVQVVDGDPGAPGLWVSDRATDLLGLRAGDTARVGAVEVPVAGVYRDLSGNTVDRYWCSNADMVLIDARAGDLVPPPLLLLADEATFAGLLGDLDVQPPTAGLPTQVTARGAWDAALQPGVTVTEADALIVELACGSPEPERLRWCLDGQPAIGMTRTRSGDQPLYARDDADFVERYLGSHLPFVTQRSRAIRTSVGGGIWPIAAFGALAGAGLVAASASLWFERRRRAVSLLTVRGVSPGGLGVKAVLELLVPLLLGVGAGIALAYTMVVQLGPSSVLEPRALTAAAATGVVSFVVATGMVAAVVAWRARPEHSRHRRRVRWSSLPWELPLAWATYVSYQHLGDWGVPTGRGADVSRVDLFGLMFPLLFLVTVVAVVSRVLGWTTRPMRAASRRWPTALYLGVRRVTRYRIAVLGLLAAAATSAGVLGYAATMRRSLDTTLSAKAETFVGSDAALRVDHDDQIPTAVRSRSTRVDVYPFARITPGTESISVIAIDPATFEQAAFWDDSFADEPLSELLTALARPPRDGLVPAVVVQADLPRGTTVGIISQGTKRFDVDPVGHVRTFPGMRLPKPTVFVARDALASLDLSGATHELWVAGDREDTLALFAEAGVPLVEERQADEVIDGASFLTVRWTFGFMQSLGVSAGLLALGGVVVYIDARRRDRLLGYAFMRRMGLDRRQHRRALGVELTAGLLVGSWLGLAAAVAAAWLTHDQVDPVPRYQPDPLLRPATAVIAGLAVLAVAVVLSAAVLAQRRVDRDDPVEVLRAGT